MWVWGLYVVFLFCSLSTQRGVYDSGVGVKGIHIDGQGGGVQLLGVCEVSDKI